jgi:uncharacterized OB-fold protein/acyl dehydratase
VTDDVLDRVRPYVGRPAESTVEARDPVNVPMIRHWCDAMGDTNPAYLDEAVAKATRHGGLVAPAAMLQAWCMDKPGGELHDLVTEVMDAFNDAGFTSVVATNYEQDYHRELRPGDLLREERTVEDVSELKQSKLGAGHFVTMLNTYRDERGDIVGTSRMRVLRFRPAAKPAPVMPRPRPPVNRDNAFFWDGIENHQLLLQRCASCERLRHPPGPMCPSCGSLDWTTQAATGRGTVHSWVVHHHPPLPGFELPVTVLLVDLEEGVRFVADLADAAAGSLEIGMAVEVDYVTDDGGTLPRFRRASA